MKLLRLFLAVLLVIGINSCARMKTVGDEKFPAPPTRQLNAQDYQRYLAAGNTPFEQVKPILDSRCVACHACYDAPCQLQMGSGAGIERGASKVLVYDATRLHPAPPTRLFIDASTTAQWRTKGFYPVLNETKIPATQQSNLDDSVLNLMLQLKNQNPTPGPGPLPDSFALGLDRKQQCTTLADFPDYASNYPLWGMPYGLPGLTDREQQTVVEWISQGAITPAPPPISAIASAQVVVWEKFLNGSSLKQQVVSRYLYEHLFLGHLYFASAPDREFFRMVRSSTPPGKPIVEIATVRPFDDPGKAPFYYRLRPVQDTIVDKTHMPYELSDARMKRFEELFIDVEYSVTALPSYQPEIAANPFKSFAAIPPRSRYQFMLDEAAYFVAGYMKGPVCRGQVALDVIQDRFWVIFYDPKYDKISNDEEFLEKRADLLRLPTERENKIGLWDIWFKYADLEEKYMAAKEQYIETLPPEYQRDSLAAIWDGGGANPNATLTVFRHFDSASVSQGLIGATPKTAWVMGYTLMERTHYLLVAGFDVYGTLWHQLATRLHMDFMRMEGENNFLRLIPSDQRQAMRNSWYQGVGAEIDSAMYDPLYGLRIESKVEFHTDDPKTEVFTQLMAKLGPAAGPPDLLNRCHAPPCDRPGASAVEIDVERQLQRIVSLKGKGVSYLPELSFIRVDTDGTDNGALMYTLTKNRELMNVSFMMLESYRSLPDEDNLTVLRGFAGSYPSYFFSVKAADLPEFAASMEALRGEGDVTGLTDRYGVHRTDPTFWSYSDWFNQEYRNIQPVQAGIFDLNRYDNR